MQLTPDQIALCDQFEEFVRSLLIDPVENIGLRITKASFRVSADVQDKYQSYGSAFTKEPTLANRLQNTLDMFAAAHPPEETAEQRRARRAEELRAELAKLENVA